MNVLLGSPSPSYDLDEDERRAVAVLSDCGLVPPLRVVPRTGATARTSDPRAAGARRTA